MCLAHTVQYTESDPTLRGFSQYAVSAPNTCSICCANDLSLPGRKERSKSSHPALSLSRSDRTLEELASDPKPVPVGQNA